MKAVVVTETNQWWFQWARRFNVWPFADMVTMPDGVLLDVAARNLEVAAQKAGAGGVVLLSVGHGGGADASSDAGWFELSLHGFRVVGRLALSPHDQNNTRLISAYYDCPIQDAARPKSSKQQDEEDAASTDRLKSGPARERLARWERYLKIGKTFRANLDVTKTQAARASPVWMRV